MALRAALKPKLALDDFGPRCLQSIEIGNAQAHSDVEVTEARSGEATHLGT